MSIVTRPYTRGKSIRAELVEPFKEGTAVIRITVISGRKLRERSTDYYLDRLPSDWGEGYILTKVEPPQDGADEIYRLVLANDQDAHCECRGFEWRGHCKHLNALAMLREQGLI